LKIRYVIYSEMFLQMRLLKIVNGEICDGNCEKSSNEVSQKTFESFLYFLLNTGNFINLFFLFKIQ